MKRILIIAYHFPPWARSSGYLRTLKFVKYLPEFGYEPTVLSVHPRVYESSDGTLLEKIPPSVHVKRSFSLDAKQDLSVFGRYPGFLAIPDRLVFWIPTGIAAGVRLIRKMGIDAVFSTYPISSAHTIGYWIHRLTGKPWVADFRDQMWDDYSPFEGRQLAARQQIERRTVAEASQIVVTTEGIKELFTHRYSSNGAPGNIHVIDNGYDEEDFEHLDMSGGQTRPYVRLIHAGLLSPSERDPIPFFHGLTKLIREKQITKEGLKVDLFAPGNEAEYNRQISKLDLQEVVTIHPRIPYTKVLQEMLDSDILLLFQGASCNEQIPAKAYEYLYTRRPIFALAAPEGKTAKLIDQTGAGMVVPPDQPDRIASKLGEWLELIRQNTSLPVAPLDTIRKFSRKSQASELAQVLNHSIEQG